MKGQKPQHGFTLIELIVVVAIIGLLAAIATPLYESFLARTQATRVMREVAHLKNLVEQCLAEGTREIGTGAGECNLGNYRSNLVSSFDASLDTDPVNISVVFGVRAMHSLAGHYLTWRRQATGSWECLSDVPAQLIPHGCTEQ